ncbi:cupin domain-containing protein [Pararhizobium sp. YC-54]|uniref:cupin domain-containing protein n=1 Tax=Pararhizobium sp. YC-54 TaxID=2986920 RepID=UPI0021F7B08B|nr:cupin domain-containing protein [Pararhizobium sp. YC-54]MCW0002376.1 cupin domain-containing protein [Pararhizobium sp. YC-54]
MKPYTLSSDPPVLENWGTPEDIGATTLEGDVQVSGRFDLGTPETAVFGGVYAATRGKYRVVYPFHEHATLLAGRLELTDETNGTSVVYGPGDSWVITKGTPIVWSILSDRICKSYIAATADLEESA